MDYMQSIYVSLRGVWRDVFPGPLERTFASAVLHLLVIYAVVLVIEKAYGTRKSNYRSRDFLHDLAYFFYYRSGVQTIFVTAAVFVALDAPFSFLDLKLLARLPFVLQVVLWLIISDFVMYWFHRAQHHYRFLWAFHTTHHSVEHLTFASFLRFHPVEVFLGQCLVYMMLRVLGFDLNTWVAAYLVTTFLGEIQHTQIPWRFGPAYRLIVSPGFHAHHHSTDRAQHDRNYGGLFAFWDYLFGTAVPYDTALPAVYGLSDLKPTSLWRTLSSPMELLHEFYVSDRRAEQDASRSVLGNTSGPR